MEKVKLIHTILWLVSTLICDEFVSGGWSMEAWIMAMLVLLTEEIKVTRE